MVLSVAGLETRETKELVKTLLQKRPPGRPPRWSAGNVQGPVPEQAVCAARRAAKLAALHLSENAPAGPAAVNQEARSLM
jgi:hypothetical protein